MRQLLQRILLLSLGLLIGLAMAEGILRLFPDLLPEDAHLRVYWRKVVEETTTTSIGNPDLGFLYPPNYDGEIEVGEVRFSYSTDEHGFRNPSPWPPTADLVAIGDSLTFSYGVDDNEAWLALAAAELPEIDIVNLGLIGAAPQQYWRIFERFGAPLQPKLLLFGLFPGNDLADAELFDRWLSKGAEGNYDVWRFFRGRIPGSTMGWRSPLEESYLLTAIGEWKRNLGSAFSSRTVDFPDGSKLRLAAGVRSKNAAMADSDKPIFRRVLEVIERAQEHCEENGTELLVLLFPTKEEVYLPLYDDPAPLAVQPFVAELERLEIEHLDLIPAFQERARQGSRLFFEIDGHPNREGYRVVADAVLDYLKQNPSLLGASDGN